MRTLTSRTPARRGYTLVELMLGLSVALVILAALASFTIFTLRMNARVTARSEIAGRIRPLLSLFESDVRDATTVSVPAGHSGPDPTTVTLSRVKLLAGQVTEDRRIITYRFDSLKGVLIRTENGKSTEALDHVHALAFRYLKTDLSPAAVESEIAAISMDITCKVTMGPSDPIVTTAKSPLIRIRSKM